MELEELKQKVLSEVTGLENWHFEVSTYSMGMWVKTDEIHRLNTFGPGNNSIRIYESSRDGKKWETNMHWRTDLRNYHYKSDKGLIKRIQLAVDICNEIHDLDKQRHAKHEKGVEDSLKALEPFVEEYGNIFNVAGPGQVYMNFAGFTGKVDLEQETVDLCNSGWDSNYAPLTLAVPFMKEVELFRLLE